MIQDFLTVQRCYVTLNKTRTVKNLVKTSKKRQKNVEKTPNREKPWEKLNVDTQNFSYCRAELQYTKIPEILNRSEWGTFLNGS